ncbi:MAG TPA: PDZ domain-containing protein [Pirellulales bacterium]|nr:PDZ domain-containing protein [Pirellulales bacterium]
MFRQMTVVAARPTMVVLAPPGLLSAVFLSAALLSAAGPATSYADQAEAPSDKENAQSPAQIAQWVNDLNSDFFAVRQAASRNLREAGLAAVKPLAVAADGRQSEVTRRAIDVLDALCDLDDVELVESAREALEGLAKNSQRRLPAQRASVVLRAQRLRQQRAAMAEIQHLGGVVSYASIEDGDLVIGQIQLGNKWTAGDGGLQYLTKLGRIEQLKLYGTQFTDEGLEHLTKLTAVQSLKLYATQISDEGQARLEGALPGTQVDRRHGALLGVSGAGDIGGCRVIGVREGTAAQRYDVQVNDVITEVNGKAIPDMTALVATIAKQKPGDRIKLTLVRDGESLEKEIVLGELGEETE